MRRMDVVNFPKVVPSAVRVFAGSGWRSSSAATVFRFGSLRAHLAAATAVMHCQDSSHRRRMTAGRFNAQRYFLITNVTAVVTVEGTEYCICILC